MTKVMSIQDPSSETCGALGLVFTVYLDFKVWNTFSYKSQAWGIRRYVLLSGLTVQVCVMQKQPWLTETLLKHELNDHMSRCGCC